MTATSVQANLPTFTAGAGWRAEVLPGSIHLTTYADAYGDPLVDAIESLLPKWVRRFWIVTWTGEDDHGNDVWLATHSH